MPSTLARLFYFLLLIVALTVPYAYTQHTYPIPTFYTEFIAFGAYVLMAAAVAAYAYSRRHVLPQGLLGVPKVAWVPLAFACWLLLQIVVLPTRQPTLNLLGAGCLLAAVLVTQTGFWLKQLGLVEATIKWGSYALLLGGVYGVFCQIVQLCGQEALFSPWVLSYGVAVARRPYGNMAQANHLGTYLAFAMIAALYLVQTRRLPMVLWLLLTTVCATGAALTISRTSWIQVAIIMGAGWLMAWVRRRDAKIGGQSGPAAWRDWLIPLGVGLIFVLVNIAVRRLNVTFNLQLGQSAAERFSDPGQISLRLALWRYGLAMFRGHWLTGVGWGEFPGHEYLLSETLGKVEIANNSHDIMVDLLAKTGLIGFAIVALGLLCWLLRAMRVRLDAQRVFGFALIGVLGAHALVEYPQQYLFFLLPVALMLGLLEAQAMPRIGSKVSISAYLVLILAGIVALVPVLRDYQRSEVLYYGKAPEAEYRAAPATLFGAWGEYGLATLLSMNGANLPYKLSMHEQAIALLPGETVLKRYAILLVLQGHETEALDVVRRLKIFAEAENAWPEDLGSLYEMCDQQGAVMAGFKAKLLALYGALPPRPPSDSDDDDS
jgi:O-antigen ligase